MEDNHMGKLKLSPWVKAEIKEFCIVVGGTMTGVIFAFLIFLCILIFALN